MKKLFLLFFLLPMMVIGQEPCGADEYNRSLIEQNPKKYQQIEERLQQEIIARRNSLGDDPLSINVTLPIVIHIVWNDSVENLHDSIIYQQIEVINRDFNLLNTDTTILTDTLKWLPGIFGIEFYIGGY